MERKEEIIHLLSNQPEKSFTTREVAEALGIQRSNASSYLNELTGEGRLTKLGGRPVKYTLNEPSSSSPIPADTAPPRSETTSDNHRDVFSQVIGHNGSVKNAVMQGKASILYPPNGLNTLITGPTGSGKSFFANTMFQFAKNQGLIAADKELQVFNCADYAKNPELLMSHLFGYTAGAFTGATTEKDGLIQQADGGMLFLDEVHRLPPEGQEMIFYFMDTGQYSRLGEAERKLHASVRIVCATTEDPKSTLLETFIRRIPINIQLPTFKQRPVSEQIDLLKLMVGLEAKRINRKVSMSKDVVRTLISHVDYGNIGQLKSNIQLLCARGFMNQLHNNVIELTTHELPENLTRSFIAMTSDRSASSELIRRLEPTLEIHPEDVDIILDRDSYELPYNIYDIIADKATLLEEEQIDQETINQYISTDINLHLKSFYKNQGFALQTTSKLAEVVSLEVIDFARDVLAMTDLETAPGQSGSLLYALSLHVSSLIGKLRDGQLRPFNARVRDLALNTPDALRQAEVIRHRIADHFNLAVPESEAYYLTVLLTSFKTDITQQVGIVLAAHGPSTASSMAKVVAELLETPPIPAIDMPLSMSPTEAYTKIKEAVKQADDGSGVLLLVDMGSLATFGTKLELETGVKVRSLDMVSTGIVLEAVRKASMTTTTLDELHQSLKHFTGYHQINTEPTTSPNHLKESAILAICASGEGTAKKIKEIVEKPYANKANMPYQVIVMSAVNLQEHLPSVLSRYNIIASTGIIDPKIAAPFIPLETFINMGASQLNQLLLGTHDPTEITDQTQAQQLIQSYIEENHLYLNPARIAPILWNFTQQLGDWRTDDKPFTFHINLALHLAGTVERILTDSPIESASELPINLTEHAKHQIDQHIIAFERKLLLTLSDEEKEYIYYYVSKDTGEIDELDDLLD